MQLTCYLQVLGFKLLVVVISLFINDDGRAGVGAVVSHLHVAQLSFNRSLDVASLRVEVPLLTRRGLIPPVLLVDRVHTHLVVV